MLRHFLSSLFIGSLAVLAACSSSSACSDVLRFSSNELEYSGVVISGYAAYDCDVVFTSGSNEVRTRIARTAAATSTPAPPAPPQTTVDLCSAAACSVLAGPVPTPGYCARSETCLSLAYEGALASTIDSTLGAGSTYDVRVECGGVVVSRRTAVSRLRQECAL